MLIENPFPVLPEHTFLTMSLFSIPQLSTVNHAGMRPFIVALNYFTIHISQGLSTSTQFSKKASIQENKNPLPSTWVPSPSNLFPINYKYLPKSYPTKHISNINS